MKFFLEEKYEFNMICKRLIPDLKVLSAALSRLKRNMDREPLLKEKYPAAYLKACGEISAKLESYVRAFLSQIPIGRLQYGYNERVNALVDQWRREMAETAFGTYSGREVQKKLYENAWNVWKLYFGEYADYCFDRQLQGFLQRNPLMKGEKNESN